MSTAKYNVAMYGFTRSVDEPRPYAQTYCSIIILTLMFFFCKLSNLCCISI